MVQLSYRAPTRSRLAIAVVAAVVLVAIAVTALRWATNAPQQGPRPASGNPVETTSSPTTAADVTWRQVAGVALPFSRLHGPRITSGGQAAGYSRSEQGAALAAVQILMRTSAAAGPSVYEPILATQVTGANLPAMKLAIEDEYQRLHSSAAQSNGNAQVVGYLIVAYEATAGNATVDVVVTSPDLAGQFIRFRIALLWAQDDWRVLAPPSGSWSTVATTLGAPPAGLLDYREMG
jgi:hypothetical protein